MGRSGELTWPKITQRLRGIATVPVWPSMSWANKEYKWEEGKGSFPEPLHPYQLSAGPPHVHPFHSGGPLRFREVQSLV